MRPILLALDGSPRAPEVIAAGIELARRMGCQLWFFRAASLPTEIPSEVFSVSPAEVGPLLVERARAELGVAVTRYEVPAELLAGIRAAVGVPWQAICDAAREVDASMIVMGSHGYTVIDRVLGTTAAKVVNHADRPVLVVRAPEKLR